MDIYQNLTRHIQGFFRNLKRSNRFYQRIFNGSLTVAELSSFLQNVSFLTAHTPQHLALAREIAFAKGEHRLAEFFSEKLGEEVGHDQWGYDDVKAIRERFPQLVATPHILPEMQDFLAGNEAMIRRNPFDYFIYVLYAEYFTVLAGPASLNAIERNAHIPKSMMSIIGKHAELDQHHVEEWAEAAVRVGLRSEHCDDYRRVLDGIMERYARFCTALSQPHEQAA